MTLPLFSCILSPHPFADVFKSSRTRIEYSTSYNSTKISTHFQHGGWPPSFQSLLPLPSCQVNWDRLDSRLSLLLSPWAPGRNIRQRYWAITCVHSQPEPIRCSWLSNVILILSFPEAVFLGDVHLLTFISLLASWFHSLAITLNKCHSNNRVSKERKIPKSLTFQELKKL